MKVRRGDVVLVVYPFASGEGASRRPALIVQNDRDNARLDNTMIAQITTQVRHADDPTQLLILRGTPQVDRLASSMIPWSPVTIWRRSMRIGLIG